MTKEQKRTFSPECMQNELSCNDPIVVVTVSEEKILKKKHHMFGRIIIFLSHLASGSCKIELINSVLNVLRI